MTPIRSVLRHLTRALPLVLVAASASATDLQPLSDEFENAGTLGTWRRVHVEEQWNAEQLEVWDIDATTPGRMTMIPYTVVWYGEWRGPYAFKQVGGDFVVPTEVTSTGRNGVSVPASLYSLGGILIRTPRSITPATWAPGGENYVFLSLGYGTGAPTFQFEVKTTTNSNSYLAADAGALLDGAAPDRAARRLGHHAALGAGTAVGGASAFPARRLSRVDAGGRSSPTPTGGSASPSRRSSTTRTCSIRRCRPK